MIPNLTLDLQEGTCDTIRYLEAKYWNCRLYSGEGFDFMIPNGRRNIFMREADEVVYLEYLTSTITDDDLVFSEVPLNLYVPCSYNEADYLLWYKKEKSWELMPV